MGLEQKRRRFRGKSLVSALLGTTFMAGVVGLASPALADGHLEAENAELRSQIEDLEQDLQILKNMVLKQNEKIAAAAEPKKPAKMVKSGKKNVSLTVSGQINRMLLHARDGRDSRTFHADNDQSSTRVRFKGKAKLDDDWSAGTTFEVEFESNSSASVSMEEGTVGPTLKERKLELFVKSKNAGKLSIGQGSTASDGSTEEDLSGTSVITSAGFGATGGSLEFMKAGAPERDSAGKVGDLFDNQDGLSRKDRLRYDTPSFSGFQLSTSLLGGSWSDDDGKVGPPAWDVALRYGRELGDFEAAAAVAYWKKDKDTTGNGGSVSVLAPSGTSLTLSHSAQDKNGDTTTFRYAKLGQTFDITSHGKTAVSVGLANTSDQGDKGNSGSYYDLALVQKVKGLGAEFYAVYGVYSADIVDTPTEDISIAGLGARIKF